MSRDVLFLMHMMDEIQFLRSVLKGVRKASLTKDPLRQRAVVRSLEVLGEAVKNLSVELKSRHPEIDWKGLAGLQDKLIHHYFGIDWDVVWDIVRTEMNGLERAVAKELEGTDRSP